MGLREQFAADTKVNTEGCRAAQWLARFGGDDRAFLIESFESDTPSDRIYRFIRAQSLPALSKDAVNDHRRGRCTCPPDARGRIA